MSIGSMPPAADTRAGLQPAGPLGGGGTLPRTRGGQRRGDRVFAALSLAAGSLVLVVIVAIAVFLVYRAVPALHANHAHFLTEKTFFPNDARPVFGIAALAFGTVVSSLIALVIAFPVALGVALFISHYSPRRLAAPLGYAVDLLAAVPSVVYGLWGISFLGPRVVDTSRFLEQHLGFVPLFRTASQTYGRSMLLAGVVLAIMILPIIASLSREVFLQVPRDQQEAALALGATRWEMVRTAVLPFGRPGVIGATMLGLGRAIGETIAVALVLSANFRISLHILEPGGNTIAANIANGFGEADAVGRGALIASGLVLFAITLVVNVAARAVIYRRREFSGGTL
jgi:phosphate transport system permease protein